MLSPGMEPAVGDLFLVLCDTVGLEVAFSAGNCAGDTLEDLVSLFGLRLVLRLEVDPEPDEFGSGDGR